MCPNELADSAASRRRAAPLLGELLLAKSVSTNQASDPSVTDPFRWEEYNYSR